MAAKGSQSNDLKIVVVGDGTVGKTCLLSVLTSDEFNWEHIPTIFQNQQHEMKVNGTDYNLDLWDTAGQENFDRLRPLSYKDVDIYLICFAVCDVDTFDNVTFKWMPELNNHANGKETFILVGTKSDMRKHGSNADGSDAPGMTPVTAEQIEKCRQEGGFFQYIETSALQRYNVKAPFEAAIRSQITEEGGSSRGCACTII